MPPSKHTVIVFVALTLAGCASQSVTAGRSQLISKATFRGTWPFTVDHGIVGCDPTVGVPGTVFFNVDGTLYGLNGFAIPPKYRNLQPIWKPDRTLIAEGIPEARVSIGDVLDLGLKLCSP